MSDPSHRRCPQCNELSITGKDFCADCGAPLDSASRQIRALIDEALKTRFKDQRYVSLETSVEVASKLKGWLRLFMFWAGIPLALIAIVLAILGLRTYNDFESKVASAGNQVEAASKAAESKAESAQQKASIVSDDLIGIERGIASSQRALSDLQHRSTAINDQYGKLQSDAARYEQVSEKIDEVQKELTAVKGQVVDLGNKTLRARSIEAYGSRESYLSFANLGCAHSAQEEKYKVAYCAQTFPDQPFIFLSQRTANGDVRTVSGVSPAGFQDASIASKPPCTAENRGTFYVEKGPNGVADTPFLCAKKSDGTYRWIQLGAIP